jgi:hypothetical protein
MGIVAGVPNRLGKVAGSKVTNEMLAKAGVTVLTGRYLRSVTKTAARITSIVTGNGTFDARVFMVAATKAT